MLAQPILACQKCGQWLLARFAKLTLEVIGAKVNMATGYGLEGPLPAIVVNVGDTVEYLSASTKKWLKAEVLLISAEGDVTVGGPPGTKPPGWTRMVDAEDTDERVRLVPTPETSPYMLPDVGGPDDVGVPHRLEGDFTEEEEANDEIERKPSFVKPVSHPVVIGVPIIGKVWFSGSVVPKKQVGGYYFTHFDCCPLMKNTEGKFSDEPIRKFGISLTRGLQLGPPTNELGEYFEKKLPEAVEIMERVGLPPKPPDGTLFAISRRGDWMKLVHALNAEWAPYVNKVIQPKGYTCAAARGKLCVMIFIFDENCVA